MRHRLRRDANEKEIVQALRDAGAYVVRLHMPVDLLVGYRGTNFLIEVKTEKGRFTKSQRLLLSVWPGQAYVVWTPEEALAVIGIRDG